jgi:hypothetical protein
MDLDKLKHHNIKGYMWQSLGSAGMAGIVIVEAEYEGRVAYMGKGMDFDEVDDIVHIRQFGGKFPLDVAEKMIAEFGTVVVG